MCKKIHIPHYTKNTMESLSFTYMANVRFKLRNSQNGKWADKNSSKQFFWIKRPRYIHKTMYCVYPAVRPNRSTYCMVIGLIKKVDFILLLWLTRTSHWAPRNFYCFVEEQQFMTGKMKPIPNLSLGGNQLVGSSSPLFFGK